MKKTLTLEIEGLTRQSILETLAVVRNKIEGGWNGGLFPATHRHGSIEFKLVDDENQHDPAMRPARMLRAAQYCGVSFEEGEIVMAGCSELDDFSDPAKPYTIAPMNNPRLDCSGVEAGMFEMLPKSEQGGADATSR